VGAVWLCRGQWFQLFAGLLIRTSVTVKDHYDDAVMGGIIALMIAMVPFCALVAVFVEIYIDLWDVSGCAVVGARCTPP
jgi:hypothetical protein